MLVFKISMRIRPLSFSHGLGSHASIVLVGAHLAEFEVETGFGIRRGTFEGSNCASLLSLEGRINQLLPRLLRIARLLITVLVLKFHCA